MKIYRLKNFTRGWLIGDFKPSVIRTKIFELGVKDYRRGQKETKHVHKKADEITVVVSGQFTMNGKILNAGDIVWLKPNQAGQFSCLKSGGIVVVKTPSVKADKYLLNQ